MESNELNPQSTTPTPSAAPPADSTSTPPVEEAKPKTKRAPRKKKAAAEGEVKPKAKRISRSKKQPKQEQEQPKQEQEQPKQEQEQPKQEQEQPKQEQEQPKQEEKQPKQEQEQPKQEQPEQTTVPSASAEVKPEQQQQKATVPSASVEVKPSPKPEPSPEPKKPESKPIPPCPTLLVRNIVDLINAPKQQIILNDQQVQQLTLEEAEKRFRWIEGTLALVLNYDVVLSDTNIWIELLTGHTSSHSDPRYNARLQFERQLEFISRLTQYRGGRFMMMSETYEEIDRFATMQDPVNPKDADMSDEATCRNIAARLAKRLILSQQRENRLRIEGITSESHHSAFADPAIIRRTVELFAKGKKVLLLTNDASVAIRAMGMCDDLQRTNDIDDDSWDEIYAPLRPMVMTFDDLKVLDAYTRQYHFLQMAAGKSWMEDVPQRMERRNIVPLFLWLDGFRPGDRYSEKKMQQKLQQQQQQQQKQKEQQKQQQQKPQQQPKQQEQPKPQQQPKQQEQPKPQQQPKQQATVPEASAEVIQQPQPSQQAPKQEQPNQPQQEQPKQEQPKLEQPKQEPAKEKKPSRRGGNHRSPRAKKPSAPKAPAAE